MLNYIQFPSFLVIYISLIISIIYLARGSPAIISPHIHSLISGSDKIVHMYDSLITVKETELYHVILSYPRPDTIYHFIIVYHYIYDSRTCMTWKQG